MHVFVSFCFSNQMEKNIISTIILFSSHHISLVNTFARWTPFVDTTFSRKLLFFFFFLAFLRCHWCRWTLLVSSFSFLYVLLYFFMFHLKIVHDTETHFYCSHWNRSTSTEINYGIFFSSRKKWCSLFLKRSTEKKNNERSE